MATTILFSLLTVSLFPFSLSLSYPPQPILNAVTSLSNSNYTAMSLTLKYAYNDVVSSSSSSSLQTLTIFSPSDSAFSLYGQPSLSLLQFHFSHLSLSLTSLKSLPFGAPIPTLLKNQSLIITSSPSDRFVSLNGVKINGSALYTNGSVSVFGIDEFFDPKYRVLSPNACVLGSHHAKDFSSDYVGDQVKRVLSSSGCSIMAALLDLQLVMSGENNVLLTLFAPDDVAVTRHYRNVTEYSRMFRKHVVPCRIGKDDLVGFHEGTMLRTYMRGFVIRVGKYGDKVMVNKVRVTHPDMYKSDWLVVHGIDDVLGISVRSAFSRSCSSRVGAEIGGCMWGIVDSKIVMFMVALLSLFL